MRETLLGCLPHTPRLGIEPTTQVPCPGIEPATYFGAWDDDIPTKADDIPPGQGGTSLKYRKEDKYGRCHYIFLYGPVQHCSVVHSRMGELQGVLYYFDLTCLEALKEALKLYSQMVTN